MKRCLRQNGLTGKQRLANPAGNVQSPVVVPVVPIGKTDEKTGIRNALHGRENPLRVERSLGPRTVPARRMKAWAPLLALAFSNWSRTTLPCDTPLLAAVVSSQAASSLLSRMVIVRPMRQKCTHKSCYLQGLVGLETFSDRSSDLATR